MGWGILSFNKIPNERERPKTKESLNALWQGAGEWFVWHLPKIYISLCP